MINRLTGTVLACEEQQITLLANGIGFGISVARPELYPLQQTASLYIYLHWNQENGPALFGFSDLAERQIFTALIGCPGIGPKLALSVLQHTTPIQLAAAIELKDVRTLSALKGIGAKKAEALIFQLQGKLGGVSTSSDQAPAITQLLKQVSDALLALQYSRTEIAYALEQVRSKTSPNNSFDELLRMALQALKKT